MPAASVPWFALLGAEGPEDVMPRALGQTIRLQQVSRQAMQTLKSEARCSALMGMGTPSGILLSRILCSLPNCAWAISQQCKGASIWALGLIITSERLVKVTLHRHRVCAAGSGLP